VAILDEKFGIQLKVPPPGWDSDWLVSPVSPKTTGFDSDPLPTNRQVGHTTRTGIREWLVFAEPQKCQEVIAFAPPGTKQFDGGNGWGGGEADTLMGPRPPSQSPKRLGVLGLVHQTVSSAEAQWRPGGGAPACSLQTKRMNSGDDVCLPRSWSSSMCAFFYVLQVFLAGRQS